MEEANETSISYLAKSQAVGKGDCKMLNVFTILLIIARDCLGKKFLVRIPQTDAQDRENDFGSLVRLW